MKGNSLWLIIGGVVVAWLLFFRKKTASTVSNSEIVAETMGALPTVTAITTEGTLERLSVTEGA